MGYIYGMDDKSEYNKAYWAANKDRIRAYNAAKRATAKQEGQTPRGQTPERQAYMKAYQEAHAEQLRVSAAARKATGRYKKTDAAYRAKNEAKLKAGKAADYVANRARILARVKTWMADNAEHVSDYHREHYEKNAERIKAYVRKWGANNRDKKSVLESRRRARKIGNGGSHTLEERREKFERLGNVCFYCGRAGKLSVDHDIPLARGGTDDIGNILPACRPCNSRKNTRTAEEFGRTNHQKIGGVTQGR